MSLTADSDRPIRRAICVRLMPDRSMLEMHLAQSMRKVYGKPYIHATAYRHGIP